MKKGCKICGREVYKKTYCIYHHKAYENLVKAFDSWNRGLDLEWREFLKKISDNRYSGKWSKEVVSYLLSIQK